jgi:L-lactate dehydrogenase complex protein LldG
MKRDNSRERILRKVKSALGKGDYAMSIPEFNTPVFKALPNEDLIMVFAENFVNTKGTFVYCEDGKDLLINLRTYINQLGKEPIYIWEPELIESFQGQIEFRTDKKHFEQAEIGITTCEALIARTGSLLVTSASQAGRSLGIFPHIHIVIAFTSQITQEISDGLTMLKAKYQDNLPSMISLVTGPSRTADIEKTLVLGAHGPKELVLFLLDDSSNK